MYFFIKSKQIQKVKNCKKIQFLFKLVFVVPICKGFYVFLDKEKINLYTWLVYDGFNSRFFSRNRQNKRKYILGGMYEKNISTKKKTKKQGSWFPSKNEHKIR